jgi:hypothetical protein
VLYDKAVSLICRRDAAPTSGLSSRAFVAVAHPLSQGNAIRLTEKYIFKPAAPRSEESGKQSKAEVSQQIAFITNINSLT